jgi:hypothetical protein
MSKALVNLHFLETTYCLAFKASFFNSGSSSSLGPATEEFISIIILTNKALKPDANDKVQI